MAGDTVRAAAGRIAEHAATHHLERIGVVLHGGEPLLLGAAGLSETITVLRRTIEPITVLDLRMQSNGVLLTEEICDVLLAGGVRVGISLDGDRSANDRHRRFATGASSHPQVLAALALLRRPKYRPVYAGILCTVDIRNDPVTTYEALVAEHPPRIDFLLPHATWDSPPLRSADGPTPYADWLGAVHRHWLAAGRPVGVRLFDSLRSAGVRGRSGTESVGLDPADVAVIETDGAWEHPDSLKTAYDGAPGTGLDVFRHGVDDVAALLRGAGRQSGLDGLCATCRACPVVQQCGGGLYAHRYRTGAGFDNPSVYCADLKELIRVMDDAPTPAPASPSTVDGGVAELVADLSTGRGSASTMDTLAAGQLAIARALVAAVVRECGGPPEPWLLLQQLDKEARGAVDAVLGHPFVRVWAVRCLGAADKSTVDTGYLAWLAAAAAVRAGVPVDVPVPVRDGRVHLPTVATYALTGSVSSTVVSVEPAGVSVAGGERWPVRYAAVDGLTVPIEDVDPGRDCYEWPVTDRLSGAEVALWRAAIEAAWRHVLADAPGYVPGLRGILRAVVPLRSDPAGQSRGATARHAFGGVGVSAQSPDSLALSLVHEIQHGKLGALMDVCDLYDDTYEPRLSVGWRDDDRPLEGVLQGAYAHLAVADVWSVRAARSTEAAAHFRRYRDWTGAAIDAMLATSALTPAGERLVSGLGETLHTLRVE